MLDRIAKKLGGKSVIDKLSEELSGSDFNTLLMDIFKRRTALTGDYYYPLRFQTYLITGESEINLADGGVVDWTQKLLSNKRQRFFISANGLELAYKLPLSKS